MWVVRDKKGTLALFQFYKPKRRKLFSSWSHWNESGILISPSLFPDLKWEDEPLEVELVSKKSMDS